MNKLFTKITSLALGAAMMIGVGVAVGNKSVGSAYADSYTITFKTASSDPSDAWTTSVTAADTIESSSTGYVTAKPYSSITRAYGPSTGGLKLGGSSNKSGEITIALAESVTPTSIVVNAKRYNSSKAVTLNVNSVGAQSLSASWDDYTYDVTSEISSIVLASTQYCFISSITVNYSGGGSDTRQDSTVSISGEHSISLFEGESSSQYTATSTPSGLSLTWSSTDTNVATVANGVITAVASGTCQVKASFAGDTDYKPSEDAISVTVTGPGETEDHPYTVSEARAAIDAGEGVTNVYVYGIVSQVLGYYSNKYISYWLSSDGETNLLEAYNGLDIGGASFSSVNDIQVGDEVVVYGNLTKYNSTYELAANNKLVSLNRPTPTNYSVGYNANQGTGAPAAASDITPANAVSYQLAVKGDLARDGYETDGWATTADGAKVYDFGETVDLTAISTNNSLTLFAHWNKVVNPNKIIFADEGLTNGVQYTTFGTDDDSDGEDRSGMAFTITFAGGGNDGKYYDTGTGIRTYSGGSFTITAKNSKKLSKVTFVWSGNYKPSSDYTLSDGTYNTSTSVWTGLVNSITMTKSGSDNWRLQSVEIEIGTTLVTSITVSPSSLNILSDDTTPHIIEVTVLPNDADNSVVSITSNNTNIATVSEESLDGSGTFTVTGKEATSGSQVITIAATDASGISATLTLSASDASVPVLTGITVNQNDLTHKTQYVGNDFDPSGLVFTPVYNITNPNPDVITGSSFNWSTLAAGQNVTGTYKEDNSIVVTIDQVTVKNDVLELTLTGDELTNPDFMKSDSWNHNGITASAEYESGASYSGSIEWSYDPATPAAMGVTDAGILTITATAGSVSQSVDVLVTVSKPREVVTARSDVLDYASIGVSGTTYTSWSNKTGSTNTSGIKYAGGSAGGNTSIQLRMDTSKKDAGIYSTSQGVGYIKSVSITFNSNSQNGRVINVYGKNEPYSALADLYDSSKFGTLLGQLTYDSDDDPATYTLNVTGDYQYVAVRSNSGAVYLDEVSFTWNYIHSASDVEAVDNFILNKMHLDYDTGGQIGSTGGDGSSCVGYYDKDGETGAKYFFTQLSDTQKEIILKSTSVYGTVGQHEYTYDEVKDRLSEWARINGETFNTDTGEFSRLINPVSLFGSTESAGTTIIIIVSVIGVSALGGFFFLRKRKEI